MKKPASWSAVKEGLSVWVRWPDPMALVDPAKKGVYFNKPGTVRSTKKGAVSVELKSGGMIDVKSLEALLIEDADDEKNKNAWWREKTA